MKSGLLHGWGGPGARSEAKLPIRVPGIEVDGSGPFGFTGNAMQTITPAAFTIFNDLALPSTITNIASAVTINGIASGFHGQIVILFASANVTVNAVSSSASLGNRIRLFGSNNQAALTMFSGTFAMFLYNSNVANVSQGGYWELMFTSTPSIAYGSGGVGITASGTMSIAAQGGAQLSLGGALSFTDGASANNPADQALMGNGSATVFATPLENASNVIAAECYL